jgi:eukaryotic-like serine/threonine-protein kinase
MTPGLKDRPGLHLLGYRRWGDPLYSQRFPVALAPGLRLGPYEIQSPLGAGGMGEVYRARDTRLDRIVAIKVLSSQLSSEPQFRERFDREARAISALEHAHICPLYDIGEHEGTSFLVMQYLEGETLDARLQRGPLPFDSALQYAMQIADALDKAHRAGIVHRDLKPGNVMLTKAGAKLLDFGLAKASPAPGAGAGLSMLPTTPPGLTAQGTILGTFQYMAPEQLEGQDADAPTDIFAFGAVLYEMLTGKKAFEGRSQASLISAILKDHPPDPSTLQPLAPRALDRVVRTCLAKDPDDRWQGAGDLHRELGWIRENPREVSAAPSQGATAGQLRWLKVAVAALAIVLLASLGALISRRFENDAPGALTLVRFAVPTQTNLSDHYSSSGFALSPDGRTLAYVDGVGPKYTLFVRSIDSLESRALVTGDLLYSPFWSPDGRSVAVFADDSLKTVSVADGTIQTVCPLPGRRPRLIHGGTWGSENVLLFAVGAGLGGGLYRVAALGGTPVRLFEKENAIRWPQILPGGRRFLYAWGPNLYVGTLDGTPTAAEKPIMQAD